MSIQAACPDNNATVFASAGTGKTWLLVTRLLRLLLEDVRPDSILAITFTKKAAAEMQLRLFQRLREWAVCDDEMLKEKLGEIECPSSAKYLARARSLYEKLLLSPQPLRTTTFHAFCNDLLKRFPLEANLPPGFEVIEQGQEYEYRQLAWSTLMADAGKNLDSSLASALDVLFDHCGLHNTRMSLESFLQHRSDWWAWTEKEQQPVDWATQQLQSYFSIEASNNPIADFFTPDCRDKIRQVAVLLAHAAQPSEKKKLGDGLLQIAENHIFGEKEFSAISEILLTKNNTIRKLRKASKKTAAAMGENSIVTLEENWQHLAEDLITTIDLINRKNNFQLNCAWYEAGACFLRLYQAIKSQHRQLDFSDLEWQAYRLLNSQDDALWVQYKLDQKLEHMLIDEFQDTNPTQWRLLLPLLEEFAASNEKKRSVFIVGDEKQSIYAFRRANPELQNTADQWLRNNLHSQQFTMATSWRSAPAIMDVVNQIFTDEKFAESLPDFKKHSTHKNELWGRVELLPKYENPDAPTPPESFRNPLKEPRGEPESAHDIEASAIATRITELIDDGTLITESGITRPVQYGDIKILLRKRTHVKSIELALQARNIPYQGSSKGSLLKTQEISDLISLLTLLQTPQDNLALARVLRSPFFSASDEDLIELAMQSGGNWFERLPKAAAGKPDEHPFARAEKYLQRWRKDSALLPLHDLLSKIYFEADILSRYQLAAPVWQRQQIRANLKRLISLALEIDSGRYPSMNHFLLRLEALKQADNDAPSEPTPDHKQNPVEILTIHSAKGLEAPVIFLADFGQENNKSSAWEALIDWPANTARPKHFLLQPATKELDAKTHKVQQRWQQKLDREKANLLYVALTRAQQMLIISASESKKKSSQTNSYDEIKTILEPIGSYNQDNIWIYETGSKPTPADLVKPVIKTERSTAPTALRYPLELSPPIFEIAPSRMDDQQHEAGEHDGRLRGIAIHYFLEKLSGATAWTDEALCYQIAADLNIENDHPDLGAWLAEARSVIQSFPDIFDAGNFETVWNELPILYRYRSRQVYGIIDRVVSYPDHVLLIDYKTHTVSSQHEARKISAGYQQQVEYYVQGLKQLWPDKDIQAKLLFTAIQYLHPVAIENGSENPDFTETI